MRSKRIEQDRTPNKKSVIDWLPVAFSPVAAAVVYPCSSPFCLLSFDFTPLFTRLMDILSASAFRHPLLFLTLSHFISFVFSRFSLSSSLLSLFLSLSRFCTLHSGRTSWINTHENSIVIIYIFLQKEFKTILPIICFALCFLKAKIFEDEWFFS